VRAFFWSFASFGLLVGALVGGSYLGRPPSTLALVDRLSGEHWYRLDLAGRRVGHYSTRTWRDQAGVHFETAMALALPDAEPLRVEERLDFSSTGAMALTGARHLRRGPDAAEELIVTSQSRGLVAAFTRGGHTETRALDWSYALEDHLAIERWLEGETPEPGAHRIVPLLDLERLALVPLAWEVVEHTRDGGWVLRQSAPLEDKLFKLDARLVPEATSIAGLFHLTRTDPATARGKAGSVTARQTLHVPLAEPLDDPRRIRRLLLEVNAAAEIALGDAPGRRWSSDRRMEIVGGVRATSDEADVESALVEELRLPTGHPLIRALAFDVLRRMPADVGGRIEKLTRFVHTYLSYDAAAPVFSLLEAIEERRGDCTEFADLFTTLARALGLPARTVTGLAYAEDAGPAFYLHAWNEVAVDGQWRSVDPTFDQIDPDATHIRFSDSDSAYLRAYAALPDMRFKVREVGY